MIFSTFNILIWILLITVTYIKGTNQSKDLTIRDIISRLGLSIVIIWFGVLGFAYSLIGVIDSVTSIWSFFK